MGGVWETLLRDGETFSWQQMNGETDTDASGNGQSGHLYFSPALAFTNHLRPQLSSFAFACGWHMTRHTYQYRQPPWAECLHAVFSFLFFSIGPSWCIYEQEIWLELWCTQLAGFRHQILIPEAMRSGAASFQQGALEQ